MKPAHLRRRETLQQMKTATIRLSSNAENQRIIACLGVSPEDAMR
jgi:hypothetical protein